LFIFCHIINRVKSIFKGAYKLIRTEVKLMGKGNPESADAIFAKEPTIFLANKLFDKNKMQT